ncbi:MAG TPA: phosphatase PAP2 family protein, partial [Chitinophagaceae bacterium]|nr:phosphatase PAP2 family protein [Chitinophagaceae bacterium]
MNSIINWDQWFFIKINSQWTNGVLDQVMPFLRYPLNWAPLYLFLLVFMTLNFRRQGWWWSLFFVCTVALTDMVSNRAFKHVFERLRPCNDPSFAWHVRLLLHECSGGFSFTSNHAANHFGMATFLYFTLRHTLGRWALIAFLWAGLISYAQVYVGVHYPLDILAGALIGVILGLFTGMLFNKRFGIVTFGVQPT